MMYQKEIVKELRGRKRISRKRLSLFVNSHVALFLAFALIMAHSVEAAVFDVASGDIQELIGAISEANANGEDDTINLSNGSYTLTEVNNSIDGPNGLPSITNGIISIIGTGADTIIERSYINGTPNFRIFHIGIDGTLRLEMITVSNGKIRAIDDGGGAIFNRGNAAIINSIISVNIVVRSFGAGIRNWGIMSIENSSIYGNDAQGNGGGIYNDGTLTMINSTISGNSASFCGGIYNGGPLTIKSSTIADNNGGFGGGGICSTFGEFLVKLQNTIIALNTARVSPNCTRQGAFSSRGHNLIGKSGECGINTDIGDIVATNPMLGPLTNNGGLTPTHALLPGSPAIDAGDEEDYPITDQRGFPRPVDGNSDGALISDIGAYEIQYRLTESAEGIPRYRLYNPFTFHHHYTTDANEYNALETIGWIKEGISCYLCYEIETIDSVDAVPYYRVYNPNSFEHHWTTDANEYNVLGTMGWIQEGADGYVFASQVSGSEPLYRLYNPNDGLHHWTMDSNERTVLMDLGFIDEGIACYVFP